MTNEKFTGQRGVEKIRTPFAQTIFRGTDMGLYYGVMYYNPADGEIHVGYSSYNPQHVFEWLDKFFVIDRSIETDFQKVVRCGECAHCMVISGDGPRWCKVWHSFNGMGDEGYCNYGERRSE